MKGLVMIFHLISIITYNYYSCVEALSTLILVPLIYRATRYVIIINYELCYHDENIKTKIKIKYKGVRKEKGYKIK